MTNEAFDESTLQAIGELLALGEQEGFGITFVPDDSGWSVGYMRGMAGGDLLAGFDLGDTVRGAVRPLLDLSQQYKDARREREGK
jgi:hypothetical protein